MTSGTSTNRPLVEISPEKIHKAMQDVGLIPRPNKWILLSPEGVMWKGSPEELLAVLIPHHPLLNPRIAS